MYLFKKKSSPKDMLTDFREKEREKEREGQKYQCKRKIDRLPFFCTPAGLNPQPRHVP